MDENEPNHGKKLRRWIEEDPERGSNVQETLCAISDIFADTTNLENKYVVVVERRDEVSHGGNPMLSKEYLSVVLEHA